jgi:hypothetical protein
MDHVKSIRKEETEMSNTLKVKVKSRTAPTGQETWEGTVTVPGLRPSKLVRKADGKTEFSSRSAVNQAAKNLAKSLGYEIEMNAPNAKKAAKKSVKKAASKNTTTDCSGGTCNTW